MAFPLGETGTVGGEVYVCLDQAKRQAPHFGSSTKDEIRRLIVHGTLHLAGYRDGTPAQRQRMRVREDRYLTILTRKG